MDSDEKALTVWWLRCCIQKQKEGIPLDNVDLAGKTEEEYIQSLKDSLKLDKS